MNADLVDAVLPLTARDLPRSELLLGSLERYVSGLGTLYVVVPDAQLATCKAGLTAFVEGRRDQPGRRSVAHMGPGGSAGGFELRVIPELSLTPELALFPRMDGWHKQQLIKLAMGLEIARPRYLTFDADIVATRRLELREVVVDGKAPCFIDHADLHPRWYVNSEALLGQPLARGGISHNVTPTMLSQEAVRKLAAYFEARYQRGAWAGGWRGLKQRTAKLRFATRAGVAGWRMFLAAGLPWTEYALYYSFLEAHGLFDRYHFEAAHPLYDGDRSVWFVEDFEGWDPTPLFAGEGPPYFVVLQSNTGIGVEAVRARLADHL